jgi:hypothetical protein
MYVRHTPFCTQLSYSREGQGEKDDGFYRILKDNNKKLLRMWQKEGKKESSLGNSSSQRRMTNDSYLLTGPLERHLIL